MRSTLFTGLSLGIAAVVLAGCGGGEGVSRGPSRTVVSQAVTTYEAAGHSCHVQGNVAVCDLGVPGRDMLVIGYDEGKGVLGFATAAPTQALGKDCPQLTPALQNAARPAWMTVRCDFADDAKKIPAIVVSGTTQVPERGLSRAEFNQLVSAFLVDAEHYLANVVEVLKQSPGGTVPAGGKSTNL
jgi:hypothetical protein